MTSQTSDKKISDKKTITSSSELVAAEYHDHMAVITIDNPSKHNIMNLAAWRALPELMQRLANIEDIRLIVIRGAGDEAFVAGADISEFDDQFAGDGGLAYDAATVAAFEAMRNCPLPTLAAIKGFCMGGGLGLALACDLRFARDDAIFSIPAARLGLAYPASAVHHLQHIVGRAMAADLLFSARRLKAPEAHAAGLVQHLVSQADFESTLQAYCGQIINNAPLSIQAAKFTLDQPHATGDHEIWAKRCLNSKDYAEGRQAFRDKRAPHFSGR